MKSIIYLVIISTCFLLSASFARAQLLTDSLAQQQIKQALDKVYNFEFNEAEPIIAAIQKSYPKHPVSSMLMALSISWKNFPMDSKSQIYQNYQDYLKESLSRTKSIFGEDTD